jgi:hypothetical protein
MNDGQTNSRKINEGDASEDKPKSLKDIALNKGAIENAERGIDPEECLIKPLTSFMEEDIPEASVLIQGMLRQGEKLVMSGPSKAGKSWAFLNMWLAISSGEEFWGKLTTPSKALFVNLELRPRTMQRRIDSILKAMGLESRPANSHLINLREWMAKNPEKDPFEFIERQVALSNVDFKAIFIDPIYKTYGNRSENDAGQMAELFGRMERLGNESGTAVLCSAHFAKGNASAKSHIDRASGSGVFARDPDCFITMSPHEDDGCYTIESTFRDWAPMASFVVENNFPLMERADKDPSRLKGIGGASEKLSVGDVMSMIPNDGIEKKSLQEQAIKDFSITGKTFRNKLTKAEELGKVYQSDLDGKYYLKP